MPQPSVYHSESSFPALSSQMHSNLRIVLRRANARCSLLSVLHADTITRRRTFHARLQAQKLNLCLDITSAINCPQNIVSVLPLPVIEVTEDDAWEQISIPSLSKRNKRSNPYPSPPLPRNRQRSMTHGNVITVNVPLLHRPTPVYPTHWRGNSCADKDANMPTTPFISSKKLPECCSTEDHSTEMEFSPISEYAYDSMEEMNLGLSDSSSITASSSSKPSTPHNGHEGSNSPAIMWRITRHPKLTLDHYMVPAKKTTVSPRF